MNAPSNTTTDQPTLAVSQMRRARVHAALRSIEEGTRLDDLTDDEIDMIIDAARDHRTTHEPRPAGDLREAAQRVVDDYPAAAGACASIEGGDGKPGWGSIRRLAEALATHSPAPMAGEGWQDIASAPKDGTWVDLWWVRSLDGFGARVADAVWADGAWRQSAPFDEDDDEGSLFVEQYGPTMPVETSMCKVTHWMKVSPPAAAQPFDAGGLSDG